MVPNVYFVCGKNAYVKLPKNWYGTCYLAVIFPQIFPIEDLWSLEGKSVHRGKRGASAGEIVGDIFGAMIHCVGVILNDVKVRKLSTIVDNLSVNTARILLLVDGETVSIRAMVLQNRLALDVLLAKAGGVCKLLKVEQCCTYIPENSWDIRKYISNISEIHQDLRDLAADGLW
ncbi:syncytin-2-like [Lissotriton helveticus]